MMSRSKKPLISIIGGKGKMGGWFDNFFKKQNLKVLISDVDTGVSNKEAAKRGDIVIVSVPVNKTVKVIENIRSYVREEALLCDITSLKLKPVEAMKQKKGGVVGTHPLFGPLVQDPKGETIIFCPIRENKWSKLLKKIFKDSGIKIIEITPEEHDKQVAIVQALIHFSNIGLARTLYSQKSIPRPCFFTPVFRLQSLILGRILGQKSELYADIEIHNPYFLPVLDDFKKEIKELGKDVKEKNLNNFKNKFKETSNFLDGFRKLAQTKSVEILRIMNSQPIKVGKMKGELNFKGRKRRVGFLGPEGTFSFHASSKVFADSDFIGLNTIGDIFEKVNNGEVDFGVVPAENSTAGIVSETVHQLTNYPLKVTGSFDFKIHHCLLSKADKKEDIKIVKSHRQALSQSKNWLQQNLPQVELQSVSSTVQPIKEGGGKEVAFIAPKSAADIYNLNILEENIEDNKDNFTKFYLISKDIYKKIQKRLNADKTLVLFAVYDRVGILRDILDVFAESNLNLTALHSIPSRVKPWDYLFFTEVESFYPSDKIKKVLKQLEKYCPIIRVIGVT